MSHELSFNCSKATYSFSNLLKAGAVFFTTTSGYGLLNLFNLTGGSAREWDQKGSQEAGDRGDFSIALSNKRGVEGIQVEPVQSYIFNLTLLDGSNGFSVPGYAGSELGFSVSTAGDFNGDGISDLVLGDQGASSYAGSVYVLFGKFSGWSATFNLATLNGSNGFSVVGATFSDLGSSVSTAGDVNGDGISDVILGADGVSGYTGAAVYILFGKASGWPAVFNLTSLNGSNGVSVSGYAGTWLGCSVNTAGDINDDGISDLVIGASNGAGTVYVIFGKTSGWPAAFNLTTLNGSNGFNVPGLAYSGLGSSVSTAGDVNGDGISDLVMGASTSASSIGAGAVYVLFGKASGWPAAFNLTTLNGSNGFSVPGLAYSGLGSSVSTAGDVNGDGISDVVMGAPARVFSSYYTSGAGVVYVLFGKASGWPAMFSLTTLNGSNGFSVPGLVPKSYLGSSVSTAGDMNGDGITDVVLGAPGAYSSVLSTVYVLFGKANGWLAAFDLTILNGNNGFSVAGFAYSGLGSSVSTAGDVNGDGITDVVLGAPYASSNAGAVYILFGSPSSSIFYIATNQLTITEGEVLTLSTANINTIYMLNKGNTVLLSYLLSNVHGGYFQLITDPSIPILSFTQADLSNQRVQFVQDGSINLPGYQLQVSDGAWVTLESIANVTFIKGTAPVLVNHAFTVYKGIAVNLKSSDLSAYDLNLYGGGNSTLIFQISDLQSGQFELVTNPGIAVTQFIQQQIAGQMVLFVHDGSNIGPIASVNVINSFNLSNSPVPFVITFIANNTNSISPGTSADITGALAGGVVGGALLLAGAIGGGFWYRKRAQDANTRKQCLFADYIREALKLKGVDNFNSEKGRLYVSIIQKLMIEFSNQGTSLEDRSEGELKAIARDVAKAAKSKITNSTTCFGYSEITIEDMDYKIPALVHEVLRMRVGLDEDTAVPMASM